MSYENTSNEEDEKSGYNINNFHSIGKITPHKAINISKIVVETDSYIAIKIKLFIDFFSCEKEKSDFNK